jgi:hypothetical protein
LWDIFLKNPKDILDSFFAIYRAKVRKIGNEVLMIVYRTKQEHA